MWRTKTARLICTFQRTLILPELANLIVQVYRHSNRWNFEHFSLLVRINLKLNDLTLNFFLFLLTWIGQTENDSLIPFTIEWIPDVLFQSKFGELTIHFQFGHQRHPLGIAGERSSNKRLANGMASQTSLSGCVAPRRKKLKAVAISDTDAKDLQNLNNIELDFDGVAPLNDSEFQELTKSVP